MLYRNALLTNLVIRETYGHGLSAVSMNVQLPACYDTMNSAVIA